MGAGPKRMTIELRPCLIWPYWEILFCDNAPYTCGGPDVISQVRDLLPPGWRASLLAVDGATTLNIPDQIHHLPKDCTHLVLSVGGNNALMGRHFGSASRFLVYPTSNSHNHSIPWQTSPTHSNLSTAPHWMRVCDPVCPSPSVQFTTAASPIRLISEWPHSLWRFSTT